MIKKKIDIKYFINAIMLLPGFYYMSVSWILVGVLWLLWGWRTLSHMQDVEVWHYLHMIVMMDLLLYLIFSS